MSEVYLRRDDGLHEYRGNRGIRCMGVPDQQIRQGDLHTRRRGCRMRLFRYANTLEAVELAETAPLRERRSPLRHLVARYLY